MNQMKNNKRQLNWLRSMVSSVPSTSGPVIGGMSPPLATAAEAVPRSSPSSADAGRFAAVPVGKTPHDSFRELRLPFSSDESLRQFYMNAFSDLRVGMLLEDLDSMAGLVAYEHSDGFARNLTIVTASLDRLELRRPLRPDLDVVFQGCVTYVGNSSMEVRIDMFQTVDSAVQGDTHASALFTMVARQGDKAASVPPLICISKAERERFEQGIMNKMRRKEFAKTSLDVAPPSPEEKGLVHWLFLTQKNKKKMAAAAAAASTTGGPSILPSGEENIAFIPMDKTRIETTMLIHPQNRNIHGRAFGGFLLRNAFELGFIAAKAFCGPRPLFVALDDNSFLQPVEIGSVLQFVSEVIFQDKDQVVVRVTAQTLDVQARVADMSCNASSGGVGCVGTNVTNVFHFTFRDPNYAETTLRPHKVLLVPDTLQEANLYIEGKRVLDKGLQLAAYLSQKIS